MRCTGVYSQASPIWPFSALLDFFLSPWGDKVELSSEGIQQGEPLGPLHFCLTIHNMCEKLSSEYIYI